jgi:hypothetical protein
MLACFDPYYIKKYTLILNLLKDDIIGKVLRMVALGAIKWRESAEDFTVSGGKPS